MSTFTQRPGRRGTRSFNETRATPPAGSDSIDLLPWLLPPGEEEAGRFYLGLPSCPRLVGRASAGVQPWEGWETQNERWRRDLGRGAWFLMDRKSLGAIGNHAIRHIWYPTVRDNILEAIGRLPWTSVDVFRIGSINVPLRERPVVVWIGVENSDIAWDVVARALRACRRALDAEGLTDVDCQIRVSKLALQAGPPLLSPASDVRFTREHTLIQPFTTALGQSVFPFSNPACQGTLGVYLTTAQHKDDKGAKNSPLYALTCHHVAFPNKLYPENLHYSRQGKEAGSPPLAMGLPGQSDTAAALEGLLDTKQSWSIADEESGEIEEETERRVRIGQVDALYDAVKAFEPVEARKIGSVYLSPPIGRGSLEGHPNWTRDWCLIEMDRGKLPDGVRLRNLVDLRSSKMTWPELAALINSKNGPSKIQRPKNSLLLIVGVIPLAEIRNPPGPMINAQGDECILVGKRGAGTGLTWGSPSGLESTIRQCLPNGEMFMSQEWAIHGSLGDKTVPFSGAGDSGAAVFGIDGRLGGFITRGTGPGSGFNVDITYATPAALVLTDIKAMLGQSVVLL